MNIVDLIIIIEQDDPSGWHAYAPELKGCHSFGDSAEEAKRNVLEAAYAYLLEIRSQKKSPPKKRKFIEHLSVGVPSE